jgi:hypothetical protein
MSVKSTTDATPPKTPEARALLYGDLAKPRAKKAPRETQAISTLQPSPHNAAPTEQEKVEAEIPVPDWTTSVCNFFNDCWTCIDQCIRGLLILLNILPPEIDHTEEVNQVRQFVQERFPEGYKKWDPIAEGEQIEGWLSALKLLPQPAYWGVLIDSLKGDDGKQNVYRALIKDETATEFSVDAVLSAVDACLRENPPCNEMVKITLEAWLLEPVFPAELPLPFTEDDYLAEFLIDWNDDRIHKAQDEAQSPQEQQNWKRSIELLSEGAREAARSAVREAVTDDTALLDKTIFDSVRNEHVLDALTKYQKTLI